MFLLTENLHEFSVFATDEREITCSWNSYIWVAPCYKTVFWVEKLRWKVHWDSKVKHGSHLEERTQRSQREAVVNLKAGFIEAENELPFPRLNFCPWSLRNLITFFPFCPNPHTYTVVFIFIFIFVLLWILFIAFQF